MFYLLKEDLTRKRKASCEGRITEMLRGRMNNNNKKSKKFSFENDRYLFL